MKSTHSTRTACTPSSRSIVPTFLARRTFDIHALLFQPDPRASWLTYRTNALDRGGLRPPLSLRAGERERSRNVSTDEHGHSEGNVGRPANPLQERDCCPLQAEGEGFEPSRRLHA